MRSISIVLVGDLLTLLKYLTMVGKQFAMSEAQALLSAQNQQTQSVLGVEEG